MHEVVAFIGQCMASGMLLRSTCAVVIVPIVAWLAVRTLTPSIERLSGDPRWQAPLAAVAAIIPGGLLVALSAFALMVGFRSSCLQTAAGQMLFLITVALLTIAFVRATFLARRRSAEARSLVAVSRLATGKLAEAARALGVSTRILDDATPFCALAGTMRPVILVSTGALGKLTDAELRATLLHERGHAQRGDQVLAATVAFMIDLLPLPASRFVSIYWHARELAADDHALRQAAAHDLAAALLAFVKAPRSVPTMASIADRGRLRLERLLRERSVPSRAAKRRAAVAFALGLIVLGGISPALADLQHAVPCLTTSSTIKSQ